MLFANKGRIDSNDEKINVVMKNIVNKINIILFLESILNCFNVLKEGDESSSLSIKLSGNL